MNDSVTTQHYSATQHIYPIAKRHIRYIKCECVNV
jgi:hypothetical protein